MATSAGVGITALGGMAFWLIAARRFPASEVGAALGLFQSLLFVNYLTQLGLPMVLAHLAPGRSAASTSVFAWALRVRTVATGAVAVTFVLVVWRTGLVAPLRGPQWPLWLAVFGVVAVGVGIGTLAETRLVTLRLWWLVVVRAAVPVAIRIPLLLVASRSSGGDLIFLVAAAPVAATGLASTAALLVTVDRPRRTRPHTYRARLIRYASVNWISMLATEAPIFLAPVIVAASVDAAANAPFLVSWNIAAVTFVLPHMVSQVLLSEASNAGEVGTVARRTYLLCQTLTCTATIVAWLGAGVLADIYGPDYAAISHQLPILVGANIAWVVTSTSLAVARTLEQSRLVIGLGVTFALSTIVPTSLSAPVGGASAAAWSWFFGNCVTALGALYVHRDLWRRRGAEPTTRAAVSPQ